LNINKENIAVNAVTWEKISEDMGSNSMKRDNEEKI